MIMLNGKGGRVRVHLDGSLEELSGVHLDPATCRGKEAHMMIGEILFSIVGIIVLFESLPLPIRVDGFA